MQTRIAWPRCQVDAGQICPPLKGQKSDFNDAEAIAEAVQRPTMKFVAKTRLRADEDRRRRRPIRFGVNAVRYSFIVMDLHHLLLAGLPAHSDLLPSTDIVGVRRHVANVPKH
jgi:hypothetical protein